MENRPIGRQKKVVTGSASVKKQGSSVVNSALGNRAAGTGLKNTCKTKLGKEGR